MLLSANKTGLGAVHKLRLQEEGGRWSKKPTLCKLLYHRKCKWRGVGGQKKPNIVNIVCDDIGLGEHLLFVIFFDM